jgi:hydrogenase maturation factor
VVERSKGDGVFIKITGLAAVHEDSILTLRDPTRVGLATTVNEIAQQSGVGMLLQDTAIPVRPQALPLVECYQKVSCLRIFYEG